MTMRAAARWLGRTSSVVSITCSANPALAEPSTSILSLAWEAPPECPDRDAVLERVGALLGERSEPGSPLQAHGRVTNTGTAWALALRTTQGDADWERSLEASSCDEVAEAGALILALAIDPHLADAAPTAEPSQPPDAQNAPEARSPARPAAASTRSTRDGSRSAPPGVRAPREANGSWWSEASLHLRAGALVDVGSLPRPALGAELALGLGRRSFELSVVGTAIPAVREVIAGVGETERGGELDLWTLGARGCYVQRWEPWVVRACIGMEGGSMRATGFGATGWTATERSGWWAARFGGSGSLPLAGPIAVQVSLEGLAPARRPEFVIEGVSSVHQASALVGRAAAALEVTF